jgi:membrane protease YdiL (CAAX protease family)
MIKINQKLLSNDKINLSVFVGLLLSLFGINVVGELFKIINISANSFLGQILFSDFKKWLLAAIIIIIVSLWEKRSFRTIGIKKTDIKTVILAIVFGVISVVVGILLLGIFYSLLGLEEPNMLSSVGELPFVIKLLTITTAAITEELLYRGYSLERLG